MAEHLEGTGFLLRDDRLVTPVRYRLRWSTDDAGRSRAEGELWSRRRLAEHGPGPFVLLAGAGFSVPLEVVSPARDGWVACRRVACDREELRHGMG